MELVPRRIILHCSATRDSKTYSWDDIRDYHINHNGWVDCGYHYGIEEFDNDILVMRGRPPWEVGAHCRAGGRNYDSLGVCVVGDYDEEPPDLRKYTITVEFLASLCTAFHILPEHVHGHREFESAKTCPGLRWNLDQLREDVSSKLLTIGGQSLNLIANKTFW